MVVAARAVITRPKLIEPPYCCPLTSVRDNVSTYVHFPPRDWPISVYRARPAAVARWWQVEHWERRQNVTVARPEILEWFVYKQNKRTTTAASCNVSAESLEPRIRNSRIANGGWSMIGAWTSSSSAVGIRRCPSVLRGFGVTNDTNDEVRTHGRRTVVRRCRRRWREIVPETTARYYADRTPARCGRRRPIGPVLCTHCAPSGWQRRRVGPIET